MRDWGTVRLCGSVVCSPVGHDRDQGSHRVPGVNAEPDCVQWLLHSVRTQTRTHTCAQQGDSLPSTVQGPHRTGKTRTFAPRHHHAVRHVDLPAIPCLYPTGTLYNLCACVVAYPCVCVCVCVCVRLCVYLQITDMQFCSCSNTLASCDATGTVHVRAITEADQALQVGVNTHIHTHTHTHSYTHSLSLFLSLSACKHLCAPLRPTTLARKLWWVQFLTRVSVCVCVCVCACLCVCVPQDEMLFSQSFGENASANTRLSWHPDLENLLAVAAPDRIAFVNVPPTIGECLHTCIGPHAHRKLCSRNLYHRVGGEGRWRM